VLGGEHLVGYEIAAVECVLTERRALFHDPDLELYWLFEEYRLLAAKAAGFRGAQRPVCAKDHAGDPI